MILDVAHQTISSGGTAIHLTGQESTVVAALAVGGVVSRDWLIHALYNQDEPDSAERVVWLLVHRIRTKFRSVGWPEPILNRRGRGYEMAWPIQIIGQTPPVVIPHEHRAVLESLLYSHPNRAAADRVLASFVGR